MKALSLQSRFFTTFQRRNLPETKNIRPEYPLFLSLTLTSARSCLALFWSKTKIYSTYTICSSSMSVFFTTLSTSWCRWTSSCTFSKVRRRSPTVAHNSFHRLSTDAISSSRTDKSAVTSLSLHMSVWRVDVSVNVWCSDMCSRISCCKVCWKRNKYTIQSAVLNDIGMKLKSRTVPAQ